MLTRPPGQGLTPALRQWFSVKEEYPEAILFFQMGDFYELFFEDATTAAPLLELTLTSRQKLDSRPVPMCGVPLSAGDTYITRLCQLGHKVAVCDQIGSLPPKGGLAERMVKRVVTPGTVMAQDSQTPAASRYLAALAASPQGGAYAMAAVEISTGDFILGQWPSLDGLWSELAALEPSELILSQSAPEELAGLAQTLGIYTTRLPYTAFAQDPDLASWHQIYGPDFVPDPADTPLTLACGSAALGYCLSLSPGSGLTHLAPPRRLWTSPGLGLDEAAVRNLELVRTLRDSSSRGTIFSLISLNTTPMGGRLLKDWLVRPLGSLTEVSRRQAAVEVLVRDGLFREELTDLLKKTQDLERALSRLTLGRGTVRDLAAVQATLAQAEPIQNLLAKSGSELLAGLAQEMDPLPDLQRKLKASLADNPLGPGAEIIRQGLSSRLDELRDLESGGKQQIAALEAKEKSRTGINNLKVGFNKVFGYYLEVTKSNLASVPAGWQRKQTVSGGERYVTDELKQWEEKILSAGEDRALLEERILENLKNRTAQKAPALKSLALRLAAADALAALAASAVRYSWVRPSLTQDDVLEIQGGRHPAVEAALPAGETFVANDIRITPQERLLIITGPNMAGKS
ncbi:MAG: DNA mismatch repair protein MutS, partial [Deltaproteobacteria bacterium]|nr:DNA mismatch repair protein MutS [Deltaproteobacteria bacterium]